MGSKGRSLKNTIWKRVALFYLRLGLVYLRLVFVATQGHLGLRGEQEQLQLFRARTRAHPRGSRRPKVDPVGFFDPLGFKALCGAITSLHRCILHIGWASFRDTISCQRRAF